MSGATAYMERYLNVEWKYANQDYAVRVGKYLIALADDSEQAERYVGAQRARQRLLEQIRLELKLAAPGNVPHTFRIEGRTFWLSDLEAGFRGKASPGMLARVLWLATHYQFIRRQDPAPPPAHKVPPTFAQNYADWYLGTDCSGFVNSFEGRAYPRHLTIEQYDGKPSERRRGAGEIVAGDLLIKTSAKKPYSHIAVVETVAVGGKEMRVKCVESLGDGGVGVTDTNVRLVDPNPLPKEVGAFRSLGKNAAGVVYYFQPAPGGAPVA